ncbi:MAG: HD domain-containing protein [Candidatus Micrarchaeia archaeon]
MDAFMRYVFEAGMLKRVRRSGWWTEKIDSPESVADHTFRTAIIAFALAKMEGMDDQKANRVCTAAVFHDMHETRLLDMNKITARYITVDGSLERKVERDQIDGFEPKLKDAFLSTLRLADDEQTVLKDADYLECAFQAKEYADIGYPTAKWVENISRKLQTKSARAIAAKLAKADSGAWRDGLKKL